MKHFLIIGGAVALFLLACLGFVVPGEMAFYLTCGWAFFLARVVPRITLNVNGLITAVVCLLLLSVGLHFFLQSMFKRIPDVDSADVSSERRWHWRWSFAILAVIVLLFVAGISVVGITHQTTWIVTSKEPIVQSSSISSDNIRSRSNLRQIGCSLHAYHDTHDHFPPGCTLDEHGTPLHGWQTILLPYIEQVDLASRINLQIPWNHPDNAPHFQRRIRLYLYDSGENKSAEGYALSHYAGNVRVLGGDKTISLESITRGDGTANTLLAGEAAGNYKPWGHPMNWRDPALGINKTPDGFGSPRPSRAVFFLFADGSVRTISDNVDPKVLRALSTPNGGETILDPP